MGLSGNARCERASGQKQVLDYRLPFAGDVRNSFSDKVFIEQVLARLSVKTIRQHLVPKNGQFLRVSA
jgi:hypothetical protein